MSFSDLSLLAREAPVRIVLAHAGAIAPGALGLAGFVAPLAAASRLLDAGRLLVDVMGLDAMPARLDGVHIALLFSDAAVAPKDCKRLATAWQGTSLRGGVGTAVLSLARAGLLDGARAALPWQLAMQAEDIGERVVFSPRLYERDGALLTCAGGAASQDCAMTLVEAIWGAELAAQVKEELCIDHVRGPQERQRVALQARFGVLQPKLSEAVTLMEANIEEPLSTDDIAALVGLSRRQLERQFKQYLDSMPSRYYLSLRLERARRLLRETNDSIVQIGLMCGFSSGSHFSTAYGAQFGITPREERQRRLRAE